jgi:hypothetical protein
MEADGRVYDFRTTISNLTNVPPERQKGVVKFTMIGTPEDQSFRDTLRETENIVSSFSQEMQHGLITAG